MLPKYVPIVKAKQGEFSAYENTANSVKRKILPLFEIPQFTEQTSKRAKYKSVSTPIELYLTDLACNISSVYTGLPVIVDIFKWAPNSKIEVGEHILEYVVGQIRSLGTPVIPVIGYDRWNDIEYSNALRNLSPSSNSFCFRFESIAFEDMKEDEFFHDGMTDIISSLNLDPKQCNAVLDFGDVTSVSIEELQEKISMAVSILNIYNFKFISIAGCSISPIVTSMVPSKNSSAMVLRREMIVWKSLRGGPKKHDLIFGDYGITSPNAVDGIIAPDANGKIRYTVKDNYFVVRGHSRRIGNKGAQMYDLSKEVINSGLYLGAQFSWGDQKVLDCSNEELKGNLSNWVAFDTNHHLNLVLSEVFEFEQTLIVSLQESNPS